MSWQTEAFAVLELLQGLIVEPRTAVLMTLLIIAACIDVKTHRIPNVLVMIGIAFAIPYNGLYPAYHSQNGWLVALSGLGIGFIAFLPLYLLRAMGAGDVKLMAMVGAFVGPWPAVLAALWSCVAGGVIGLAYLVWTGNMRRGLGNVKILMTSNLMTSSIGHVDLSVSPSVSAGKLPYGVAIATGTIAFLVARQLGFTH